MSRVCRYLIDAIVIIVAIVAIPVYAQQSATQGQNPLRPKQDNWQRMKECADQVTRISKRAGMRTGQGEEIGVLGIENHYSQKYERCYVRVSYVDHDWKKADKVTPLMFYDLWDAFEEKLLSVCTDFKVEPIEIPGHGRTFNFCTITIQGEQQSTDCTVCQRFVRDRMTN